MYSEEEFNKYKRNGSTLIVYYYADEKVTGKPIIMEHKTYEEYVEFYKKWEKRV